MNILIVTSEIGENGGGLSLSCSRLLSYLGKSHNVEVTRSIKETVPMGIGGYSKKVEDGIRYEYNLKQDVLDYSDFDIIIGFGGGFNGYYASLLSSRIRSKFILTLRGSDINLAKWNTDEMYYLQKSIHSADKIVCLSEEMKRNILLDIEGNVESKIVIIPNEFTLSPICQDSKNFSHSIVLGCASAHLNEKKGICNLLHILKSLSVKDENHDYSLELAGRIDADLLAFYKSVAKELGISAKVRFIGYLGREMLYEVMKKWDIYVQTSVCEGHPNIIGEFLSLRKPFISTRTGFIYELLSQEYPCFFFSSFKAEDMSSTLLSLVKEQDLGQKIRCAAEKLYNHCNPRTVHNLWQSFISPIRSESSLMIQHIISVALHDVKGNIHDSITTPEIVFETFVDYIYKHGYRLCSMAEYISMSTQERDHSIVLTFDDGYDNLIKYVMPILKRYDFTATVYVCTGLIGKENSWNNKDAKCRQHLNLLDLHELHDAGWEIGSHGVLHRNLLKLDDMEIASELGESKEFISKEFGSCLTYSYPYGAFNAFIQSCVKRHYDYAFAVTAGGTSLVADKYQIRRYSISQIYDMIANEK